MTDKEPKLNESLTDHENKIRQLFRHITLYCGVNAVLILVWLLTGMGYFWPFWVIAVWGGLILYRAITMKALPPKYQQKAEEAMDTVTKFRSTYEDKFVAHVINAEDAPPSKPAQKPATSSQGGTETKSVAKKPKAAQPAKKSAAAPAKPVAKKVAPLKKPVEKSAPKAKAPAKASPTAMSRAKAPTQPKPKKS